MVRLWMLNAVLFTAFVLVLGLNGCDRTEATPPPSYDQCVPIGPWNASRCKQWGAE